MLRLDGLFRSDCFECRHGFPTWESFRILHPKQPAFLPINRVVLGRVTRPQLGGPYPYIYLKTLYSTLRIHWPHANPSPSHRVEQSARLFQPFSELKGSCWQRTLCQVVPHTSLGCSPVHR